MVRDLMLRMNEHLYCGVVMGDGLFGGVRLAVSRVARLLRRPGAERSSRQQRYCRAVCGIIVVS